MSASPRILVAQALTAGAFAEFGDVVEARGTSGLINSGTARQFADLAGIDVAGEGARVCVSIYRTTSCVLPLPIRMLERHPLGSQLFMPLSSERFLVVVAPAAPVPDRAAVRAFVTNGHQGVNYRRGTWHHPLIAYAGPGDFLVIDRAGPGPNCEEFRFGDAEIELHRPG